MEHTAAVLFGGMGIAGFVGFLTGIFGVGGGFLMTPALIILLRIPFSVAVGTDLAAILATSSFSIFRRRGSGTMDVKLALVIAAGSIMGVILGQRMLEGLEEVRPLMIMGHEQEAGPYVVLCAFLVLLIWIAGYLTYDYRKHAGGHPIKRVGALAKLQLGPTMQFRSLDEGKIAVLPLVLLGMVVGTLTGLMGIGGGVVLLPALIYLVGLKEVKAAGTSLILVWMASVMAVVLNAKDGNIDLYLLLVMIVGGVTGAYFGTHVGLRLAGAKLRFYFVFVVVAAIVLIGYKVAVMTFGGGGK